MKNLVLAVFISLFSLTACAKEEPKAPVKVEAVKKVESTKAEEPKAEEKAAPKTKKVCVEQKDPKTGKVKEVCKTIKIHKKFEGTKVPEKAPKKK